MGVPFKYVAEIKVYDFDCTKLLGDGETIVTDSVSLSSSNLTFTSTTCNLDTVVWDGGSFALAGKVIQTKISGGIGNTISIIRGSFTTSLDNTIVFDCELMVIP